MEGFFYAHRPLWCLIFGRVLEQHPGLRVVFTEQQAMWVTETVPMIDGVAGGIMRARTVAPFPLRPSEYFHRQCFVANSLMTRRDIDNRAAIGTDVLVWGRTRPTMRGHGQRRAESSTSCSRASGSRIPGPSSATTLRATP